MKITDLNMDELIESMQDAQARGAWQEAAGIAFIIASICERNTQGL